MEEAQVARNMSFSNIIAKSSKLLWKEKSWFKINKKTRRQIDLNISVDHQKKLFQDKLKQNLHQPGTIS
jgi:hypothetical protein